MKALARRVASRRRAASRVDAPRVASARRAFLISLVQNCRVDAPFPCRTANELPRVASRRRAARRVDAPRHAQIAIQVKLQFELAILAYIMICNRNWN